MAYSWQRTVPQTASVTRRTLAFAVDAIIVFALAWTATFMIASAQTLRIPDLDIAGQQSPVLGLLWIVSVFELSIMLLYTTLFEGFTARTPGKMLAGLRVTRLDGRPITMGDAFLRNLLKLLWVTPFGPAFVILDAWSLRVTELDQRMGDLAAGTIVVSTAAAPERL